jgi:hypothetical protein
MMKLTGTLGALLASVVVVPAAALGPQDASSAILSLESALSKTVETLELLAGIRKSAEAGEPVTAAVATSLTEPAIPGARERDEALDRLRTEVGLLQQELDVVEARRLAGEDVSGADAASDPTAVAPARPSERITFGLPPDVRDALRHVRPPAQGEVAEPEAPPAVEQDGYSADRVLQAQACYRAEHYARGLALLAGDTSAGAVYWRGRCLERLDRLDEAAEMYERVAQMTDAGSYGERARTNLDFVRWRAEFLGGLSKSAGGGQR